MTHPFTTDEKTARSREFWLLLTISGIQFTHILDFMIMMPLGPQLTRLFGISDAQFGLLVSAYTLAAGVSGLVATTYVDRFDRKRLLLVLYGLFAVATLACGLAPGYGFLMAARVAAGLFGGVLGALAQTIVADVVPFERRGRAMGMVMSSFSVATVAGVPAGLLLASRWGWQMPFISIALLSSVLAVAAAWTMPPLRDHLGGPERPSVWQGIAQVLKDRNHLNALGFSALMMFTGFTIIPYFTIYLEANVGLVSQQIPYVYLCGGIATLFTARLIGRLADRLGKARVFRWLAVGLIVPMLLMSSMRPMHIGWVLVVSTLLFVFLSGRMIPGMALLTGAANPALRGTFMAFNSAVQSAAMGAASIVGGLVIGRDAAGQMTFYWAAALVGATASLLSLWFLRRLKVHDSAGVTRVQG
jgi:predicted MFS family arabinose efflux permease